MRTKICLVLLVVSGSLFAQATAALQAEVKRLYTAAHDIDITALTEMICTDDADAYAKLDNHFQNEVQKFRYVFTNAKYNFGAEKTIDGKTYYPINFRNVVRVTYFNPIDSTEKQELLKKQFNAQSIVYDKTRNAFLITYTAKLAAINDNGWKFVFLDETLPAVYGNCLTENIKNTLGL